MENEMWRPIKGYEGSYEVSDMGNVRSLSRNITTKNGYTYVLNGRILRQNIRQNGYAGVILCKNGVYKPLSVHRIVAETFIPNPNNYPQVNHKDENKVNNRVDNLEWCTISYNVNYGTANVGRSYKHRNHPSISRRVGMYDKDGNLLRIFQSGSEASRQTGVHVSCLLRCCRHEKNRPTAGGYKWEYINF